MPKLMPIVTAPELACPCRRCGRRGDTRNTSAGARGPDSQVAAIEQNPDCGVIADRSNDIVGNRAAVKGVGAALGNLPQGRRQRRVAGACFRLPGAGRRGSRK